MLDNNGSTDNCGIADLQLSADEFDCSDLGVNTVTLTATDVNGNTAICTVDVTIEDNEDPIIICPADITVDVCSVADVDIA